MILMTAVVLSEYVDSCHSPFLSFFFPFLLLLLKGEGWYFMGIESQETVNGKEN